MLGSNYSENIFRGVISFFFWKRLGSTGLKVKLNLIFIPVNWSVLCPNDHCDNFVHTEIVNHTVSANMYLNIDSSLNTASFVNGENISLSLHGINDIRQVETILYEIALILHTREVIPNVHFI